MESSQTSNSPNHYHEDAVISNLKHEVADLGKRSKFIDSLYERCIAAKPFPDDGLSFLQLYGLVTYWYSLQITKSVPGPSLSLGLLKSSCALYDGNPSLLRIEECLDADQSL